MKVLVAGFGNILRADDAFGVEVARRLETVDLPPEVKVVEASIAGIVLVHELQAGFDALVVVDTVDLGRPPGNVMLIEPDVIDVNALTDEERHDMLADMHVATPWRALMLARALGVLPPKVLEVGCQPVDPEGVGEEMSPPVAAAVDVAVKEIIAHIDSLLADAAEKGA